MPGKSREPRNAAAQAKTPVPCLPAPNFVRQRVGCGGIALATCTAGARIRLQDATGTGCRAADFEPTERKACENGCAGWHGMFKATRSAYEKINEDYSSAFDRGKHAGLGRLRGTPRGTIQSTPRRFTPRVYPARRSRARRPPRLPRPPNLTEALRSRGLTARSSPRPRRK